MMLFALIMAICSNTWASSESVPQIKLSLKSPFSYAKSRSIASTENDPVEKKWLGGCVMGAGTYLSLNQIELNEGWTKVRLAKGVCLELRGQIDKFDAATLKSPYRIGCLSGAAKLLRTFEGLDRAAELVLDEKALVKALSKYCED